MVDLDTVMALQNIADNIETVGYVICAIGGALIGIQFMRGIHND